MAANSFSDLPSDVVDLSIRKLFCVEDVVRSSAVCKSWQSVASEIREKQQHTHFSPWLMLTPPDDDNQDLSQRFFNFSTRKILSLKLSHTAGKKCWGSPFGWLITTGLDRNIHLFNPLSHLQLPLPPQTTLEHQYDFDDIPLEDYRRSFLCKSILSSNPSYSPSGAQVMVIYGSLGYLAFAHPGDETWTSISKVDAVCQDVIFFKGQFYAITNQGEILICNTIDTSGPTATHFVDPPDDTNCTPYFYLVEMFGDLHMVERNYTVVDSSRENLQYKSDYFLVHKLDFHSKSWTTLDELGDYALFIGNNTSFSISTLDYPDFKSNSIYFTDDHAELMGKPSYDMGVYDYLEELVETNIYVGNDVCTNYYRHLFFMPSFSPSNIYVTE